MYRMNLPLIVVLVIVFLSGTFATEDRIYEVRDKAENEGHLSTSLQAFASFIRDSLTALMAFPWELVESVNEGDISLMEVVQYELPVLIPAALGIVVAIIVLLVTPCLLCCRCCGCCGSRLKLSHIRKQRRCCMYVTAVFIVISVICISFSAYSSYYSGVTFRKSPRFVLDAVDGSFDDLPRFVTNFGKDMLSLVERELNDTLDIMKIRIQDLPNILSEPLTDIAGPSMSNVNWNLEILVEGKEKITVIETQTNNTVDDIILRTQELETGILNVNNNLTQMKNKCVSDGKTFCHLLLEPFSYTADFNVSELSDLSTSVSDLVVDLDSVNLTEIQSLGNNSLSDLPETITNSSKSAVTGVLDEIDKIPGNVLPELNTALEFTNLTRSSLGMDSSIDSFRSLIDSYDSLTTPLVDKIVLPTVAGYMGFVAFLAFTGLLLGCLCSRQGIRASSRSSASHIGSACLMCSVVFSMLPVVIFLLLSAVLMLVGGNLVVICTPIQDLTLLGKLEKGYLDLYSDDMLKDTLNISISMKQFFETCRDNGTVYSGFDMADKFNLSTFINVSSFVPELGPDVYDSINETIRDMNVLDAEAQNNLTSSFSFPNITGDNVTQSMKDDLVDINLAKWSNNLTDVAAQLPDQNYADSYRELAQVMKSLDENEKYQLLKAVEEIDNITIQLDDIADRLQNSSVTISDELANLQHFIQDQATEFVFKGIDEFLDEMAVVPLDFINLITQKMSDDVGHCRLVWDVYEMITSSFCSYMLDSLNVFWMSFYVGGFSMVVLMISSCTIGKYFRKPHDLPGQRMYQNMSGNAVSPENDSKVVKEMHDSESNDDQVKRTLPEWYYRVVKQKQQKHRKRCYTGYQSPQLIRIQMLNESLQHKRKTGRNEDCLKNGDDDDIEPLSMAEELYRMHDQGSVNDLKALYCSLIDSDSEEIMMEEENAAEEQQMAEGKAVIKEQSLSSGCLSDLEQSMSSNFLSEDFESTVCDTDIANQTNEVTLTQNIFHLVNRQVAEDFFKGVDGIVSYPDTDVNQALWQESSERSVKLSSIENISCMIQSSPIIDNPLLKSRTDTDEPLEQQDQVSSKMARTIDSVKSTCENLIGYNVNNNICCVDNMVSSRSNPQLISFRENHLQLPRSVGTNIDEIVSPRNNPQLMSEVGKDSCSSDTPSCLEIRCALCKHRTSDVNDSDITLLPVTTPQIYSLSSPLIQSRSADKQTDIGNLNDYGTTKRDDNSTVSFAEPQFETVSTSIDHHDKKYNKGLSTMKSTDSNRTKNLKESENRINAVKCRRVVLVKDGKGFISDQERIIDCNASRVGKCKQTIEISRDSNMKRVLKIQVKPYKDYYRDQPNIKHESKTGNEKLLPTQKPMDGTREHPFFDGCKNKSENDGESENKHNMTAFHPRARGQAKLNENNHSLSMLAARAVAAINGTVDSSGPKEQYGKMTATCKHGGEKTTYL